jgi:type II secretory pathway component PulF
MADERSCEDLPVDGPHSARASGDVTTPLLLRALGADMSGGRLRVALERVAAAVESGASLDVALASQRGRVPASFRGLVLCGSRTAKLGEVLHRYAGSMSLGAELERWLWLRMMGPIVSAAVATALLIFVAAVPVKMFRDVMDGFGVPLPRLTVFVFDLAALVTRIWLPLLVAIAVALVVCWIISLGSTRRVGREALSMIPVLGHVLRLGPLAEFSHLLAMLLESHVPLEESLKMAAIAVDDWRIEWKSAEVADDVSGGMRLGEALALRRLFPEHFVPLVHLGEDQRGLSGVLHVAGDMFEARARGQAAFASTVVNVVAGLAILGVIVVTVVTILGPTIGLITRLSG